MCECVQERETTFEHVVEQMMLIHHHQKNIELMLIKEVIGLVNSEELSQFNLTRWNEKHRINHFVVDEYLYVF